MIIILLIVIIVLVRSNINGATKEKNLLPVFFRILLNHLQIITLTASFDFEWPPEFTEFFAGINPVSDASTQIFSIDCFLDTRNYPYL
jgi:hypothetical protein